MGSRVLDSWYYAEEYQRKKVAYYCCQKLRQTKFFKKSFRKCFQIGCLKVRNSTRKTLTLRQSPSNNMLQYKSFTGKIMGNLVHKSLRWNMHKLFNCIRKPLESFLACLTFHGKEYDFVICIRGRTLDPPLIYLHHWRKYSTL